jgi:hypothetical protein
MSAVQAIQPLGAGEPILDFMESMRLGINESINLNGDGKYITVQSTGHGRQVRLNPGFAQRQLGARWFSVKSVSEDHLVCRAYSWRSQTEGSVDILVAKPYQFRKATFDGKTWNSEVYAYVTSETRTVINPGAGEGQKTEFIHPSYTIADDTTVNLIMAIDIARFGGTGITATVSGKPVVVSWQDINDDGRVWEIDNTANSPAAIGDATEGTEAIETTTWDVDSQATTKDGLQLYAMTRVAYYHAGDKKLYGYTRLLTFDVKGRLKSVGAEVQVEIDALVNC